MAKITINPIQSGTNLETAINLRLQQIEDAFNDDVLWRANFVASPNDMEVDLDLGGNDLLNVGGIQLSGYGDIIASFTDVYTALDNRVLLSGDTMTGPLTLSGAPVSGLHAATKAYVDTAVASGGTPISTKGDLISWDTAPARLGVGTDGQALFADSAAATGLSWGDVTNGISDVVDVTSASSPVTPVDGTFYNADTSGGAIVFNLPSLVGNDGFKFAVKKVSDDETLITLTPNGAEEIDGANSSITFSRYKEGYTLLGDEGAAPDNWNTMNWGAVSATVGEWTPSGEVPSEVFIGRDLSKGTTSLGSLSVATETTTPRASDFNADGTKLFVVSSTTVYQYTCSTPYDITTATYDTVSKVVPSLTGINGMNFKSDGTKVFFSDGVAKTLYIYPLTVAWDISTITSTGSTSYAVGGITGEQNGGFINPDGTHAYWCNGLNPDTVDQVILRDNWSFGEHSPLYGGQLDVFAVNPSVEGCHFSPDGTKFWVIDDSVGMYQFTCSVPYDITTGTYDSYFFDMTAIDNSIWHAAFNPDASRMYVCGFQNDSVYQFSVTQDAIPSVATQETRGAVSFASSQQAYDGLLSYEAISPATVKMSWTDIAQLNQNFTLDALQPTSGFITVAGLGAMQDLTTGASSSCTVYGYKALSGHISGTTGVTGPVTAIGEEAGAHIKGANNIAIGYRAGFGVNGGWSGTANTIVGDSAMQSTSGSPSFNVAIGNEALKALHTVGNNNTAAGYKAGTGLAGSSTDNTCIGFEAGSQNTFGSANVYLGHQAGPTTTTESNQLYIDVTRRSDALIRGDFSARTVTINGSLNATGGVGGGFVDDTTGTTIDFTSGWVHRIAPTAASNPTYTFTAPAAGTEVHIIGVNLGAAGTITWPATVKWTAGTEPTWTASGTDRINLLWDGTSYWADATLAHA